MGSPDSTNRCIVVKPAATQHQLDYIGGSEDKSAPSVTLDDHGWAVILLRLVHRLKPFLREQAGFMPFREIFYTGFIQDANGVWLEERTLCVFLYSEPDNNSRYHDILLDRNGHLWYVVRPIKQPKGSEITLTELDDPESLAAVIGVVNNFSPLAWHPGRRMVRNLYSMVATTRAEKEKAVNRSRQAEAAVVELDSRLFELTQEETCLDMALFRSNQEQFG